MIVADYVAKFLKSKKIKEIFMLTGYGSMYLNDSIKKEKIKYFATRNEATAPIMAASYARVTNNVGVACVTAGPGATNAIPGLAEAFVDSSPIIVISGQVIRKHTTIMTGLKNIRTFGTAEINILPIVKPLTKYAVTILDEKNTRYIFEKAFYEATNGRKGPVWIDIPLDIQNKKIQPHKLRSFTPPNEKKLHNLKLKLFYDFLKNSKKPLIVCGQGVKFSNTFDIIYKFLSKKNHIPIIFTRAAQDLTSHKKKYILGQAGIKGTKYCKRIMTDADLVINFGSRLAPQFAGHDFEAFQNAKVISVDIEKDELNKKGIKIDLRIKSDLKKFVPRIIEFLNKKKIPNYKSWANNCESLKKIEIPNSVNKKNPIDLYYFMNKLGKFSNRKNILITDAGSNYYIGGQVWKFEKGQKELTSISNAAMGLSIPLAVGASIGQKKKQVLAVTGDGSLELNIQELKTISHYQLNVKLFVINNGGYVSMHNWADTFFDGRRVDNSKDTGEGTLNLKNIAKAFGLEYFKISDYRNIEKDLTKICKNNKPLFIEVITDNFQKIFDAFKDKG